MLGWCSAEQVGSDLVAEGSVWWLASPQLLQLPGMLTALSPLVLDCSPILSSFQVILLEHIIMCRLVTGHKATALQEVRPLGATHTQGGGAGEQAVEVCEVSGVATRENVTLPIVHRQDIHPSYSMIT